LDNIIADQFGCPVKGITCISTDARGVYVILMRKGDMDLKAAIDGALNSMVQDGSLERILRKWNLWDSKQTEPLPAMSQVKGAKGIDGPQFILFLKGAWTTLKISVASFALAVPFGFLLAIGRVYGGKIQRFLSTTYIEVFRGTPVLLQLYVLYFGIAPYVKLGAMAACIIGLGLNYAAYEAEIYRSALLSIPKGQSEAAHSLGLSYWETLRYVMIPQAFRVALPPMTNDFIALLKDSSLVGVIAVVELTKRMTLAATELHSWLAPGLLCAGLYFILSFPLARMARRLEKKLHRDQHPRPA
jgi:polar amino acid transport system substrate-binding protein